MTEDNLVPDGWEVAEYDLIEGGTERVVYDPQAPCRICDEPVEAASMGGTDVCPWCDMGKNRDGTKKGLEVVDKERIAEGIADFLKIEGNVVRKIVDEVAKDME